MTDVLLIENDRGVSDWVREIVSDDGFSVHVESSAAEALGWLATERPRLILVDLLLPDMHGAQLIELLRGDRRLDGVPIVVETACPGGDIAGAEATLRKPFRLELLRDIVRRYCARTE